MTFTSISIQLPTERLTPREIEIMTFTAYGKTRSEVSQILSISAETVKEHIQRACRKLNVSNKTHASTVALALGLIAPYRTLTGPLCPCCHKMQVSQMEGAKQASIPHQQVKSIFADAGIRWRSNCIVPESQEGLI